MDNVDEGPSLKVGRGRKFDSLKLIRRGGGGSSVSTGGRSPSTPLSSSVSDQAASSSDSSSDQPSLSKTLRKPFASADEAEGAPSLQKASSSISLLKQQQQAPFSSTSASTPSHAQASAPRWSDDDIKLPFFQWANEDSLPAEVSQFFSPSDFQLLRESRTAFLSRYGPDTLIQIEPKKILEMVDCLLQEMEHVSIEKRQAAAHVLMYMATGCPFESPSQSAQLECLSTTNHLLWDRGAFSLYADTFVCALRASALETTPYPLSETLRRQQLHSILFYLLLVANRDRASELSTAIETYSSGGRCMFQILAFALQEATPPPPIPSSMILVKKTLLILEKCLLYSFGGISYSPKKPRVLLPPRPISSSIPSSHSSHDLFSESSSSSYSSSISRSSSSNSIASLASSPDSYFADAEDEAAANLSSLSLSRSSAAPAPASSSIRPVRFSDRDAQAVIDRYEMCKLVRARVPLALREAYELVMKSRDARSHQLSLQQQQQSQKQPQYHAHEEVPRILADPADLSPVEQFYKSILPHLPVGVLSILKIFLAAIPSIQNYAGSVNLHIELIAPSFYPDPSSLSSSSASSPLSNLSSVLDTPLGKCQREIVLKSAASVLHLLWTALHNNHPLQGEHLCNILCDANGLLLLLKYLNQDIAQTLGLAMKSSPSSSVNASGVKAGANGPLKPSPTPPMLPAFDIFSFHDRRQQDKEKSDSASVFVNPILDPVEPHGVTAWGSCFTLVSVLRLLHKCTRRNPFRLATLVSYKAPVILKRILRVDHADVRAYCASVLKGMVPLLGRKWRTRDNMRVVSMVYQYTKLEVRESWLGDADAFDAAANPAEDPVLSTIDAERRRIVDDFLRRNYFEWWSRLPPQMAAHGSAPLETIPGPNSSSSSQMDRLVQPSWWDSNGLRLRRDPSGQNSHELVDPLQDDFDRVGDLDESFKANYVTWLDSFLSPPSFE